MDPIGELKSSPVITRHPANPILKAGDVPYHPALVFNPGVTKYEGKYLMAFRNDYGSVKERKLLPGETTNIGFAHSADGINWQVDPQPCTALSDALTALLKDDFHRVYDPRLIVIEGRLHLCFAVDTGHGVRGGIAVTDDLEHFQVLSLTAPDNRNLVLFPEKIGGGYVRLERPLPVYSRGGDRFDIWISRSPDLVYWGQHRLLLGVENVPFSNDKIGPASPPVKTPQGWLACFHSVDIDSSRGKNGWEDKWQKRYCAGLMLLALDDPSRVIGLYRAPLLAPEAPYETAEGFRTNVIFPCGMILEQDGEVKLYYGAADTCVALATAHLSQLLELVSPKR